MEILVGKNSGFCAGVKHTIMKAEEELEKSLDGIDCLGEIIHNRQVVSSLEKKGLRIIDSIYQAKNRVIIRAHGTTKDVYDIASRNNIELIDLTCPNVLKIHQQVQDFSNNNYFIFLFGVKDHPETIGTFSFCSNNSYLIQDKDDIPFAINALYGSGLKNLLIITQTTFSINSYEEMKDIIISSLDSSFNVHAEKSICNATDLRQNEAAEISLKVDLMIIIGGKNSSNTKKLYEVSKYNLENVLLIQTRDDLNLDFVKNFKNVGVVAGASTPDYVIDDVLLALKSI